MAAPDPLTPEEIAWIRQSKAEAEHEKWLFKKFKVVWPWVVAIVSFVIVIVDWIQKHITWKGN